MRGGHAIGEVGVVGPVLLRRRAVEEVIGVRVHIDDARHDGLALHVDAAGTGRHADFAARTDGADPVAVDDDRAVLNDGAIVLGQQPRTDQGKLSLRLGGGQTQCDGHWLQIAGLGQLLRCALDEGKTVLQIATVIGRADQPVQRLVVAGPVQILPGLARQLAHRQGLAVTAQ